MATDIDKFVHDQLSVWPAVAAKYRNLKGTRTRTLPFGGILVTLQSNPGRVPVFDHGYPVRIADGGKTVSDHQAGLAFCKLIETLLNLRLCHGIKG